MPLTWEFRGTVLAVTLTGSVSNPEIERAFVGEALSHVKAGSGARVLWDARGADVALTSEDMAWRTGTLRSLAERGIISRFALVWKAEHRETVALARAQLPTAVSPLDLEVFTEESEALAWLCA